MIHFYKEKIGILINSRFIYQFQEAPKAPKVEAQKPEEKIEAPATIANKEVIKAQQKGFDIINKYRDSIPKPENLTDERLAEMGKTHPENILGSPNQLKDRPGFPKILETAARAAAEKNPSAAVVLDMAFKNESYHSEIMTVAFNKLVQSDPRMVLGYAQEKLGNSPETKALISQAQDNLSRFNHY